MAQYYRCGNGRLHKICDADLESLSSESGYDLDTDLEYADNGYDIWLLSRLTIGALRELAIQFCVSPLPRHKTDLVYAIIDVAQD